VLPKLQIPQINRAMLFARLLGLDQTGHHMQRFVVEHTPRALLCFDTVHEACM
jgi:hypothetical protein